MSKRSTCPWAWAFYGQTQNVEALILEPTFLLMYYGGFTYQDVQTLPVDRKRWFLDRLTKELTRKDDVGKPVPVAQTRALHQNDPQTRALQGMTRSEGPSRSRRFT